MSLPAPAQYAIQTIWKQLVKLDKSSGSPPWPLSVYNPATQQWEAIGGSVVLAQLPTSVTAAELAVTFDGGGQVLSNGMSADLFVPFDCTIAAWTMLADQVGDVTLTVYRNTYAAYPDFSGAVVLSDGTTVLSSASKLQGTAASPWITDLDQGQIVRFLLNSPTSITRLIAALSVQRR